MLKSLHRFARPRALWFAGLLAAAGASQTVANPYRFIALRNAFHLVPEVVVVVTPDTPPPPSLPEIVLTGIVRTDGIPKALLEIKEPKSKDPTPLRPPPLEVGEKQGPVEIVAIDPIAGTVQILNTGTAVTLTFEKNGLKPAATAAAPNLAAPTRPPTTGSSGMPLNFNSGTSARAVNPNLIIGGASSPATSPARPTRPSSPSNSAGAAATPGAPYPGRADGRSGGTGLPRPNGLPSAGAPTIYPPR